MTKSRRTYSREFKLEALLTITRLLAWVPTVFLSILFALPEALGVVNTVTETREVQRLVID